MRDDRSSRTAENIAVLKAIESLKPVSERIYFDPLAKHFLVGDPARIVRTPALRRQMIANWEAVTPGVCGAVLVRSRFIDRCLEEAIQNGLEQLVILGAGFDTRAVRFETLADVVSVFELDHPATQAVKIEKLQQLLNRLPRHVTYIGIRFERDSLAGKLLENGYNPRARTLFIWEGVTYYVPAPAVDRTLSFLSGHAGEGSALIFDYFPRSVAVGNCYLKEAVGLRAVLKQFGEEIVFGIEPDEISDFLIDRGFVTINHLTAAEYGDAHLTDAIKGRSVSAMFYLVHAVVTPSG